DEPEPWGGPGFDPRMGRSHHYAFHVSEAEFDAIFGRVQAKGLPYGSEPYTHTDGQLYTRRGGRGFYFRGPVPPPAGRHDGARDGELTGHGSIPSAHGDAAPVGMARVPVGTQRVCWHVCGVRMKRDHWGRSAGGGWTPLTPCGH